MSTQREGSCGRNISPRVPNSPHVAMAFAPRWDAPFVRLSPGPVWMNRTEDPGLFRDARGNFHILSHAAWGAPGPGGHSFSADGRHWHFAGRAYGFEVEYTDGTSQTLARRERPQVLMIDGQPAVLYNGVEDAGRSSQHTHTLAQRIATSRTQLKIDDREKSHVTVTSLSHAMIPVEGVLAVTVRGSGFTKSPHAVCQLSNLAGAAVSFDTHVVPATVLNSTALRCTPAPVHSDGLGTLTVSMDNRTFSPNASAPIRFFPLFSIAVGRRPYLSETEGTILVDPGGQGGAEWEREMLALTGGSCAFTATVGSHALFARPAVRLTGSVISTPFELDKLPTTLVDTLHVSIACSSGLKLNKYRDFQRYPHPTGGGSVSQVDHTRAGLLVDGEPWLGLGWYYSMLDQGIYAPGYGPDRDAIADLARTGVTQLMYAHTWLMIGRPS